MRNYPSYKPYDFARIVADFAHAGQKYGDGDDYIKHLDEVKNILLEFNYDKDELLCAAYLHDILEDTPVKIKLLQKYFHQSIIDIVFACTNEIASDRIGKAVKTYQKLYTFKEAIPVKLADRIANMRNSKEGSRFQKKYISEYPMFRNILREENRHSQMWDELDRLCLYGQAPNNA